MQCTWLFLCKYDLFQAKAMETFCVLSYSRVEYAKQNVVKVIMLFLMLTQE